MGNSVAEICDSTESISSSQPGATSSCPRKQNGNLGITVLNSYDKKPIANATVILYQNDAQTAKSNTDNNGGVNFNDLDPDNFYRVSHSMDNYISDGGEGISAMVIGGRTHSLVLHLRPLVHLKIKVKLKILNPDTQHLPADKQPKPITTLRLRKVSEYQESSEDEQEIYEGKSDKNGDFHLSNLSIGKYKLDCIKNTCFEDASNIDLEIKVGDNSKEIELKEFKCEKTIESSLSAVSGGHFYKLSTDCKRCGKKSSNAWIIRSKLAVCVDGSPNAYGAVENPAGVFIDLPDSLDSFFAARGGLVKLGSEDVPAGTTLHDHYSTHHRRGDGGMHYYIVKDDGFYLSKVSLWDNTGPGHKGIKIQDKYRHVDATVVPYLSLPSIHQLIPLRGCFAKITFKDPKSELKSSATAIIAEYGGADAVGEGSVALADMLNISPEVKDGTQIFGHLTLHLRTQKLAQGKGADHDTGRNFVYVIFPDTYKRPSWPVAISDFGNALKDENGVDKYTDEWGGDDRIKACFPDFADPEE